MDWTTRFEAVRRRPGRVEPRARCAWELVEGCCHHSCRLTGNECDGCRDAPVSVILPICNEPLDDIVGTIASIREGTAGPVQFVVVDDVSEAAISLPAGTLTEADAFLVNGARMGCTATRRRAVAHATGRFLCFPDAHMEWGSGNLRKLCHLAAKHAGLAYAGCRDLAKREAEPTTAAHTACDVLMIDGTLDARWNGTPYKGQTGPVQTTGMMGASYVIERERLQKAGGWIGLPGYMGSQELVNALNLQRQGIPIVCDLVVAQTQWHRFKQRATCPLPLDGYKLNVALAHRMFWSDETWWERWRPALQARTFGSARRGTWRMPADVLDAAEAWAPWPGATPESDAEFLRRLKLA